MIAQAATSATELVRQLLAFSRRETVQAEGDRRRARGHARWRCCSRARSARSIELVLEVTAPSRARADRSDAARADRDEPRGQRARRDARARARDASGSARPRSQRRGRGRRHRQRHGAGRRGARVRAVLHDQGARQGHRASGSRRCTASSSTSAARSRSRPSSAAARRSGSRCPRPTSRPSTPARSRTGPAARGRVLLVDDDDQLRRLAERMLRNAGYHVVPAASGPDALAEARRQTVRHPADRHGDARDVGPRSRARPGRRSTPTSASCSCRATTPARRSPDWQFIAKPFDRQILLAKVGNLQPGELRAR